MARKLLNAAGCEIDLLTADLSDSTAAGRAMMTAADAAAQAALLSGLVGGGQPTPVVLSGTGDKDFTGLTGDAATTFAYRLTYVGYFTSEGQFYLQLNGDTGSNYAESDLGTALGAPTVPTAANASGISLVNVGLAASLITGTIFFTAIKSGFQRAWQATVQSYKASTGDFNVATITGRWTNTANELTRINLRHTGTLAAASYAMLETVKTF